MSAAAELDGLPARLAARLLALDLDNRLIAAVLARRDDVYPMVTNRRLWVLTRFVEHLSAIGEDFHDPSTSSVQSWIAAESNRCHAVCTLRRVYAITHEDGLVGGNPMAGVPCTVRRQDRRLTALEARSVIEATLGDDPHPVLQLVAWRDLTLFAFALVEPTPAADLSGRTWGSLAGQGTGTASGPVQRVAMHFSELLQEEGVSVVAADALFPSLHPSVRFGWRNPMRPLMKPLNQTCLAHAVHRRFVDAGIRGLKGPNDRYTNVLWMARPSHNEAIECLSPVLRKLEPRIRTIGLMTRR